MGQTLRSVGRARARTPAARRRRIKLFGFVEWCLWDAQDDTTNFQRNFSTGQVEVEPQAIFHVTEYRERRNHFAYFASSVPTNGFDSSRNAFVGVHEGLDAPKAVVAGQCTNSIAYGWHPIGVHQINLELAPGEEKRLHFLLGYAENPEDQKFVPGKTVRPGQLVANKAPFQKVKPQLGTSAQVDAAFEQLTKLLDRPALDLQRGGGRSARAAHGQRLEPVPVHDHAEHVALGLVL